MAASETTAATFLGVALLLFAFAAPLTTVPVGVC